jgi:hypothetical protein
MKKIVTLVSALLLVSAVSALAATGPFWAKGDYYAGSVGTWNADAGNAMTEAGGIWTASVTSDQAAGPHGFKVANSDWSENYGWNGNNVPIYTTVANEVINFSFDGNTYSDGYLPVTNIVWSDHCIPSGATFAVIGDAPETGLWSTDVPATLISGVWTVSLNIATAGTYHCKFRQTGTWGGLNMGSQQGDGGGADVAYTTTTANALVKYEFNTLTGRVRVQEQQATSTRTTSFGAIKALYR